MKFECFEERSIKVDKVRPVEWRSRSVTQNPGRWIDEAAGIEEFLYRRVTQLSITNLIRTIAECVPELFTPVNRPSGNPDAICDITLNCQPPITASVYLLASAPKVLPFPKGNR